jgi:hypothetical protein
VIGGNLDDAAGRKRAESVWCDISPPVNVDPDAALVSNWNSGLSPLPQGREHVNESR